MSTKVVHDNQKELRMTTKEGQIIIVYVPKLNFDFTKIWNALRNLNFVRVEYISQYGKPNKTPRYTWCWAHIEGNDPQEPINYRGLNFLPEKMPACFQALADYLNNCVSMNYNFNPRYDTCLVGMYEDGNDSIGFHTDAESFLDHLFCANVSLGYEREFQFRDDRPETLAQNNGKAVTNEIKLASESVLFFSGVEHALPKRAHHKDHVGPRFSISFRRMGNNVGIGNTMYYCRGLAGAVDDNNKKVYQEKLKRMQKEKELNKQS